MFKNKSLQQLEIFNSRNVLYSKELSGKYYAQMMGYEGERELEEWYRKFGSPHWEILTDFWFCYEKTYQADLIVIMPNGVHLSDAKNFNNTFDYAYNECRANGRLLSSNIMTQMNNRIGQLNHIVPNLTASMVFINENCQVNISEQFNYDVLLRNQLRNHILEQKKANDYPSNNIELVKNKLLTYQTESTFDLEILPEEVLSKVTRGINCYACNSFHTTPSKKLIRCQSCGANELKSDAVLRLAIQMKYLNHGYPEKNTTQNLLKLCGGMISDRTISRILSTNFEILGGFKNRHFKL